MADIIKRLSQGDKVEAGKGEEEKEVVPVKSEEEIKLEKIISAAEEQLVKREETKTIKPPSQRVEP
jgi:hypothetical protein